MKRSRILTTDDAEAWRTALPVDVNVLGSLEYVRIQERNLGQAGRLFVTESEGFRVAYPFFLRPVPPIPSPGMNGAWDTSTPEYTGPIVMPLQPGSPETSPTGNLLEDFDDFCRSQGIVAEFAHLHPWNEGYKLLDPALVEVNREIVYVDLSWGEEALWERAVSSDCRRQIKQAIRAGVLPRRAESEEDVLAFHRLHHQTMERRSAQDHYFLPPEYFLEIYRSMPRNAFFMLSEYQGRVVAGGLYFQDATDVHWHLSAVDMDYSRVRPVNAYQYEGIRQAALAGKKRMILGGSYRTGDGIFRFKAGFSPLRVPFRVYKRIHDPERYASLTADWFKQNDGRPPEPEFFPAYRAVVRLDDPPEKEGSLQDEKREVTGLRQG